MTKFERGYRVETIFDGKKFGVEPHSAVVSPVREQVFISDSENNNIYKISTPLSLHSQPVLITGSPEGCCGHIDGELRNARMNRPKGLAVDDTGNVYVADTMNMAIRKISTNGVVTIAGGKWLKGEEGDMERASEDAKLSSDFDVVYVRSSCSLLVIDRGNRAIKAIQLHRTDCSHHNHNSSHPCTSLVVASCLFGYMLSLLQRRIGTIFSSNCSKKSESASLGRALLNTCSSVVKFCSHSCSWRSKNQSYAVHHHHEEDDHQPIRTKQHSSVNKTPLFGFHQHHHKKQTSRPQTHYMEEHSSEMIVFGAVQEDEGFRQSKYCGAFEHS
ncbi:unnamed protein product [Cuscuta campestris]|uniref:Teneurin NHL domain-containing protein n=1 Tax=Cuscuta campestris TaxID=132261 RepID=A0A484LBD5_9ASTE|nr:unnamed protein product [Cuscuta campestris]